MALDSWERKVRQDKKKPQNLDPFQGIHGLPPSTWISDEMIKNSMPVLEITPSRPRFERGLSLFSLEDDTDNYKRILGNHGYTTPIPIKAAFLADNFPTDSFTNEYGETFLQKFTDVASQALSQIVQMTGATTGTEALKRMGKFTERMGESAGEGPMGAILKAAGGAATTAASSLTSMMEGLRAQGGAAGMAGGGAEVINRMLAGHRSDFPQVWTNSGFTPSYTATIRLYNPNPGSPTATEKYIIGPLAVFLCLAVPRSQDSRTYNWPFFHKIKAKGIYDLNPAVITNITIVKGGDQQQISYNQKLSMVDIRIDFTSLYNSMLVEEGIVGQTTHRPTVRSYLAALRETDPLLSTKRAALNRKVGSLAGVGILDGLPQITPEAQRQIDKNEATKVRQAPAVSEEDVGFRVPINATQTQAELQTETSPDFIPPREEA